MKVGDVVFAFRLLSGAKLSKMDDADKFKVIKATRAFRTTAKDFDEFLKDAQEKLKPENFEEMQESAKNMKDLSEEDKAKLNAFFSDYQKKIESCIEEETKKEVETVFEKLSEDAFGKLVSSNDFTVNDIMALQDALC